MNLTLQEIRTLEASNSPNEWEAVCAEIRLKRGGRWPPDWDEIVAKTGGVASRATLRWNSWR